MDDEKRKALIEQLAEQQKQGALAERIRKQLELADWKSKKHRNLKKRLALADDLPDAEIENRVLAFKVYELGIPLEQPLTAAQIEVFAEKKFGPVQESEPPAPAAQPESTATRGRRGQPANKQKGQAIRAAFKLFPGWMGEEQADIAKHLHESGVEPPKGRKSWIQYHQTVSSKTFVNGLRRYLPKQGN